MSDIKINKVVDEDWKARVQREKAEASLKADDAAGAAASPKPASEPMREPTPANASASPAASPVPEPTSAPGTTPAAHPAFEGLVSMLATQAMYCLGLLGGQGPGPVQVNLEQAREAIDMIAMLRDKTQGNLAPEEAAVLRETLAELQRLFAARVQQAQQQAMQEAGIDPQNMRGAPPQ